MSENTRRRSRLPFATCQCAQPRIKRSPRSLLSSFHCAHFTFTQSHLPDLYGACLRFDTMPSRLRGPHSARSCLPSLKGSEYRTHGLSCRRSRAPSLCFPSDQRQRPQVRAVELHHIKAHTHRGWSAYLRKWSRRKLGVPSSLQTTTSPSTIALLQGRVCIASRCRGTGP